MSKKWERQVQKNRQKINEQRKKRGQDLIGSASNEVYVFKGRSIFLSVFMIAIAIVLSTSVYNAGQMSAFYIIVIMAYVLFSLYYFFAKRPYLKISGSELATGRWSGERKAQASKIRQITVYPDSVEIAIDGERTNWMFRKSKNLFDTEKMGETLQEWSSQHRVKFVRHGSGMGVESEGNG